MAADGFPPAEVDSVSSPLRSALGWRNAFSTVFLSASAGIRTTVLIMLAALALNWGFLLFEMTIGGLSSGALAIRGIPFGTGAFVFVFGLLIPILFFPVANYHAARVATRRVYEQHRNLIEHAIRELASRSASEKTTATAARTQLDAQKLAAYLRELPAPVALVARLSLGRGGIAEWIQRLERAAQHQDPVSGTTELVQAFLRERFADSVATGTSARLVKAAFTVNLVVIAIAAFVIA